VSGWRVLADSVWLGIQINGKGCKEIVKKYETGI
jgi:hypothetical protein